MKFRSATWVVALFGLSLGLAGCAKTSYLDKVQACIVAGHIDPDQKNSFMPPATSFPLKVIADPNFQNTTDLDGVTRDLTEDLNTAIGVWNTYGQTTTGHDLFVLQSGIAPENVADGDPRSCIDNGLSDSSFYVVDQKSEAKWRAMGFTTQVPGATIRCYSSTSLNQQIVMIRPELVKGSQFSSVLLHELGHTLGLDHSCTAERGTADYRGCDTVAETDPYRMAVMYPNLSMWSPLTSGPEIKDQLAPNDVTRADCLYP